MEKLPPSLYPLVRPLFAPLEHHLLVTALFEGNLSADVFVDDSAAPQAGFVAYNNRCLFAGDPTLETFNRSLGAFFTENFIPARQAAGSDAFLAYFSSDGWLSTLEQTFASFETFHAPRQYYELTHPNPAPQLVLPDGFSLHLITPQFIASGFKGMDAVLEEMCSERVSPQDFMEKSFGLCPVYEAEIAGWCMSEYNTGDRCEIGIATLEPHQRKGLATLVTHAFVAEAARRGYTRIGWDCWARNVASAATARKAGFRLAEEYLALVVLFGA